jgi:hypothetical protein
MTGTKNGGQVNPQEGEVFYHLLDYNFKAEFYVRSKLSTSS